MTPFFWGWTQDVAVCQCHAYHITVDAVITTSCDVIQLINFIQVPTKSSLNGTVQTNGHIPQSNSNSLTEAAGGIIPWCTQKALGAKQA